jgi:hypothetical protein
MSFLKHATYQGCLDPSKWPGTFNTIHRRSSAAPLGRSESFLQLQMRFVMKVPRNQ